MLGEKWFSLRVLILVMIAIALAGVAFDSKAQSKTFPIGKKFVASMAICMEKETAIEASKDEEGKVFQIFMMLGACAPINAEVIYLKRVHEGEVFSVYEVDIGGVKVYSITDWKPESI